MLTTKQDAEEGDCVLFRVDGACGLTAENSPAAREPAAGISHPYELANPAMITRVTKQNLKNSTIFFI